MSTPKRIQRKRTKGWRLPEGAVCVTRPAKWGNPFAVREDSGKWFVEPDPCRMGGFASRAAAVAHSIDCFEFYIDALPADERAELIADLKGKDLACWCPLDQPCHADVLLEVANAP